jgi:hypothetical protein
MQMFLDDGWSERCTPLEELAQNGVDLVLERSCGQFQDPKIVLGGARGSVGGKPDGTTADSLGEELVEEPLIGCPLVEGAAAAQHESPFKDLMESAIALHGISLRVHVTGAGGFWLQAIIIQRCVLTSLELTAVVEVLRRGGGPITAVRLGNPAPFPECVLQSLAQGLEAFRDTDCARLPVGVSQHAVRDHEQQVERPA